MTATSFAALMALTTPVDIEELAERLGYRQPRIVRETIDRLRVPYFTVKRRRMVRPSDYFAALEEDARPRRGRGRPRAKERAGAPAAA